MAKLHLEGAGCVPVETMNRNIGYCHSLALPGVEDMPRPVLAVVGGGHSVRGHIDELRAWPGDIWAICSTFGYLKSLGIRSTLFAIDPQPELAAMVDGVEHAVLATCCHPSVFDKLENVEVFDLIHAEGRANHGPTTATAAPELAIRMGYRDISFFGMDSSYDGVASAFTTHAYKTEDDPFAIRVSCNGGSFLSGAEFLMQAQYLSGMIKLSPCFKNRSGGLLEAMMADDYDVTHISKLMSDNGAATAFIQETIAKKAA